jgi:hypothetical protein
MTFIKAKKDEYFIVAMNKLESWDQYETLVTKWKILPTNVTTTSFWSCTLQMDFHVKTKWGSTFGKLKKILFDEP